MAEELGVDGDAFTECLDSGATTARVKDDYDNGVKVGISGTSGGILMNQKGEIRIFSGALPLNNLQALVDELSN